MAWRIFLVVFIVLVATAVVIFGSERRTYEVKEWWMLLREGQAQSCWREAKQSLRDPDTAELKVFTKMREGRPTEGSEYARQIDMTIRARNGFGVYSTDTYRCSMDGERVQLFYELPNKR